MDVEGEEGFDPQNKSWEGFLWGGGGYCVAEHLLLLLCSQLRFLVQGKIEAKRHPDFDGFETACGDLDDLDLSVLFVIWKCVFPEISISK